MFIFWNDGGVQAYTQFQMLQHSIAQADVVNGFMQILKLDLADGQLDTVEGVKVAVDWDKLMRHVFSADHVKNGILNLGKNETEILKELIRIAESASDLWAEGSNEIHTIINGYETTIRFRVVDGVMIHLNGFIGWSERIIGNLINLQ